MTIVDLLSKQIGLCEKKGGVLIFVGTGQW